MTTSAFTTSDRPRRERVLFFLCGLTSAAMLWPMLEEIRSYAMLGRDDDLERGEKLHIMAVGALVAPVIGVSLLAITALTVSLWGRGRRIRMRVAMWGVAFSVGCISIDWPACVRFGIHHRVFADAVNASFLLVSLVIAIFWLFRRVRTVIQ